MKLIRFLMIGALVLGVSLKVMADSGIVEFNIENKTTNAQKVGEIGEMYRNFLYSDLSWQHNDDHTIESVTADTTGPNPGQIYTYGSVGIAVGVYDSSSLSWNEVCRITVPALLVSDGQHPVSLLATDDPTVLAEDEKYGCVANKNGAYEVNVKVVDVPQL